MINNVANPSYNNTNKLNIFYFSDYHGNFPAYRRLKEASDQFDLSHKDTQNLKLSGGDLAAGNEPKKRILLYRLLKLMNLDATAVGNHEWDNGFNFYKDADNLFKKAPNLLFNKHISCNIQALDSKLYKDEGLFQSKIITKNNEKYGVIGATTYDYKFDDCKIDDLEHTKQDIAKEVEELKKKDPTLNKFIFLSHLGKDVDQKLAQSISDIDIIIGGHSHSIISGVKPGENLFISPKNEPVLVVQAGNEKAFGELSIEFDKEGKIDFTQGHQPVNTVKFIDDFKESQSVKDNEDRILGTSPPIGVLKQTIKPNNHLTEENPLGNLSGDAFLKKTNADIALLNAGGFRSFLNAGEITERNLEYCIPFSNEVITAKITGKDIADTIKLGAASTKNEHANLGLYQVAGLRYTVTADKKVKNLYTVDKNNKKDTVIIDDNGNLTDAGANKKFVVALTDHVVKELAKNGILTDFVKIENGKTKINERHIIKKYEDQRNIIIDYLRSEFTAKNKPIDADRGRIIIEKSEPTLPGFGFSVLKHKYE